ncbi:related to Histone-lysine N-methyltransferase, H3 lysine-36 specific [Cephalotrichum gorgonifer]|uniref:Histone-lysine N-methyltransferase, H3 lysine-36 specific n=1 Tax=Cephalotrichum gorgonifer TaxID=2041049 RepID=A0AAE8SRU4_9PEZI|nr:related to Histone-lysine N-methyltransferase, H3 lysine-36 specific [Cephalotrichum gorgonifer]
MEQIQLGDIPASLGKPDATPFPTPTSNHNLNGDAPLNGDLRNGTRTATSSPNENLARSNDSDDASPPPKLLRRPSQKPTRRDPPLFNDLPDATEEARDTFKDIPDCLYGSKNMGSTANDALDCDCREEWHDGINYACGEDCINRATRLECVIGASSSCGDFCQNQRFQRKLYADVSVIKTEKKGYGLRANTHLEPNDFIREYVGEVINEPTFRRRMLQYDEEGIKHFYFMSLTKNEFVDATKKGGLGRFCNHSCNPNCYVDKWVVGDKLRMGIFVLRQIQPGEEITFNYNVDRYGADPQPCYCGEPNCVGFIGGKTQTERATKLPMMVVEALGIDDADGWDTTVSKKPRKKRADEGDEEYVNSLEVKSLTMTGVSNVMASLFQSKEKWIIVKVLERIQNTEDENVLKAVVQLHVYKIMKQLLNTWAEDDNVILQVLNILYMLPRLTKNKIVDSGIESPVRDLLESPNQAIVEASKRLIEEWDALEVGYRIKRRKADPGNPNPRAASAASALRSAVFGGDRDDDPQTPASKPVSPLPSNVEIPKGPKSNIPQRNPLVMNRGPRFPPPHARRFPPEEPPPPGWFRAKTGKGVPYYYNAAGVTSWERPKAPANPEPSRAQTDSEIIQKIIDDANKVPLKHTPEVYKSDAPPSQTPLDSSDARAKDRETGTERWRSLPIEKQMKIYENTIFPIVKPVLDKFRHKLPREELKRLAKEVTKSLVASDYKNKRVQDPTAALSESWERKIKQFVKKFLDKAVAKYPGNDRHRVSGSNGEKTAPSGVGGTDKGDGSATVATPGADTTPDVTNGTTSPSGRSVKRKREDGDEPMAVTPPPPPPPPPQEAKELTAEERDLRTQEMELMRENEEAQRLEDEAQGTQAVAMPAK